MLTCYRVHDENNSDLRHIVIVLFRYSNQKMHDECAIPVIHICCARRSEGLPNVSIEIVGENLAVVVVFNHVVEMRHDFLHIFNWKSGKIKSVSMSDPLRSIPLRIIFLGTSTCEQYWTNVSTRRSLVKSERCPQVP